MQTLSFPKRLDLPLWSWFLRIIGVCGSAFFLSFSIWMLWRVKYPLAWCVFVIVTFRIFLSAISDVRSGIKLGRTTMTENGFETMRGISIERWEWKDIVRYEQYQAAFVIFTKHGETIRFSAEMNGFKEIKSFVLEKLEQIGTFEDGRKVPKGLPSISIKTLLWVLTAVLVIAGVALLAITRHR